MWSNTQDAIKSGIALFYKYFLKLCLNLRTVKKMKIVIVEPATFE